MVVGFGPDLAKFFAVGLALLTVMSLGAAYFARLRRRGALAALATEWGKTVNRIRDPALFATFEAACPPPRGTTREVLLDEHSWRDLDLEEVANLLDRTLTTAGACVLRRLLRLPQAPTDEIERRRSLVTALQRRAEFRAALQAMLLSENQAEAGEMPLVWGDGGGLRWSFSLDSRYWLLALGAAGMLVGTILTFNLAYAAGFVVLVTLNSFLHFSAARQMEGCLSGLYSLWQLNHHAQAMAASSEPELAPFRALLEPALTSLGTLQRRLAWLSGLRSAGIIWDYINMAFLIEVQVYSAVGALIEERIEALRTVFLLVGEVDACLSMASYRAGTPGLCDAQLSNDGPLLEIEDACHPLLPAAVPNSFRFEKAGTVVTGSNMAGKTTFLRTIAVNVLLAQVIFACHASAYRGRRCLVFTSMDEGDDLLAGKSYYLAEAERLLRFVSLAQGAEPVLAVVDEPLAGTNSPERHAASLAICRYAASLQGRILLSTHDVALARELEQCADFAVFHFSDFADEKGLRFDYKLRTGLDYKSNAFELLRALGFPREITDASPIKESTHA